MTHDDRSEVLDRAVRAARTDRPDPARVDELFDGLRPRLPPGGGSGGSAPTASGSFAKVVLGGAVVATAVIGAVLWWAAGRSGPPPAHPDAEPATAAAHPEPPAPGRSVPSGAPDPEPGPRLAESRRPEPVTHPRRHAPAREESEERSEDPAPRAERPDEAQLVDAARSALARDPSHALALVSQHERLFPAGVLVEEREVVAIEALHRLGRGEAAAARAARFEQERPTSPYLRRVRALFDAGAREDPGRASTSM